MPFGVFGAGDPPCPAGSICSGQAATKVGGTIQQVEEQIPGSQGSTRFVPKLVGGTKIYHATVTKVTQGTDSKIDGGTTELYIIKDNKWQLAGTTTDGGQNWDFDDDVAGAGLQKAMQDKAAAIYKNTQAQTAKGVDGAGITDFTQKKTLVNSLTNVAPAEPTTEKSGTDGETAEDKSYSGRADRATVGDNLKGTRRQFGTHSYPSTLKQSKQDKILFSMVEYQPSSLTSNKEGALGAGVRPQDQSTIGRVYLPIPSGIQDQNGCDWSDGTLNAMQSALSSIALEGIRGGAEAAVGALQDQLTRATGSGGEDVKDAIAYTIAGDAAGVPGLLTRATGAVLNPNLELLFRKPTLRPFNFVFNLAARNSDEADEIVRIIRFFKQGMAPIRTESNLFLKTPHTFKIKYIHEDTDSHPFLNQFKECALKSFQVNYTPNGNYATFRDGKMVSYQITMGFQELEAVYNDDYGDTDALPSQIGF